MRIAPVAAAVAVLLTTVACGSDAEDDADLGRSGTATLEVLDEWAEAYPRGTGTANVSTDDGTTIELAVTGLAADSEYTFHVHDAACDADPPGGEHWSTDAEGGGYSGANGSTASDEIGMSFTTGENGAGNTTATSELVLDDRAESIVVHAPSSDEHFEHLDSDRLLCGDLAAG
ncbi:hypothetical protein [Glycomyces buryatensis]|uniref:Superoxide dismutase family protein n=1 Tax=Glycomyces buryatensis TaxID=2570927 RepID=A0A4S8Q7X9_9ACTN|nr:hypothetical protein [Glycomyces buryatensis]THV39461.1 hypothetical protein FAB82_17750 [Glycomyces buryatensis]